MSLRPRRRPRPTPSVPSGVAPDDLRPGGHRPLTQPTGVPSRLDRRSIGLIICLGVSMWLVVVFGGALADANVVNARAAEARAANDALRARVEAGRREIALIQTDAFLGLEARAYGMGGHGERVFALEPGAPSPPALTRLGSDPAPAIPRQPLDEWLTLLFGR